jgi:hypothetical protein
VEKCSFIASSLDKTPMATPWLLKRHIQLTVAMLNCSLIVGTEAQNLPVLKYQSDARGSVSL